MPVVKDIIFKGKWPFDRRWFQRFFEYILPVLLTIVLAIGYYTDTLNEFTHPSGDMAWKLLLLIVFVSSLARIFPDFRILRALTAERRALGVGMFYLGMAHSVSHLPVLFFYPLNALPNYVLYGGVALSIAFLLYATSNIWSMKILKKYWKWLHRLVYLIVILTILHIFFLEKEVEELVSGGFLILAFVVCKVLVAKKIQVRLPGKFVPDL